MTMLAEHRVDRLHVRLPAGQAGRAEQVRQALLLSRWPELGTDEVVVVRRVHLRTAWGELDRALDERLNAAIAQGERQRFASGPALLMALSHDLARGTAAQAWWWQSWSDLLTLPAAVALARLWNRHVTWLPDVIAGLEREHTLATVWQQWTPDSAAQVLVHAITAHHLPWRAETVVAHAESAARAAVIREPTTTSPALPPRLQRRWHTFLQGMSPADPRVLLALVLDGLMHAPLSLNNPAGAELVARWATAVTAVRVEAPPPSASASSSMSTTTVANVLRPTNPVTTVTSSDERASPQPDDQPPRTRTAAEESVTTSSMVGATDQNAVGTATAYAGTVFLINALQHPQVQQLITTHGWFADVPHAWHVLVAVARHLGWTADDPVAQVLNELLEQDGTAHLATAAIGSAIATCAAELYGAEVWNARLLQEPGRFHLSASHLDVWLPLSAVRLPVRLAGLDLNPGWTSWLGRVVTIHYRDQVDLHDVPPLHHAQDDTP